MLSGVSSGNVQAFTLGQLYATGGTVTINADVLKGSGTVTAYGSPTINVVNNSAAYLILEGGARIPDVPGGEVVFTGAAGLAQSGAITINTVGQNSLPSMTINNTYAGALDPSGYGPAILVAGALTNLGGFIGISNATGSYGASANVSALQLSIYIPNGVFVVSNNGPDGAYMAGASPVAEWLGFLTWPGGNPANTVSPDATQAAEYVANALFPNAGNQDNLNYDLYHNSGDLAPNNHSVMVTTGCAPQSFGTCGGSYSFGDTGIPIIPYFSLTSAIGSYPSAITSPANPSPPQIYGGAVAIKASVIDIDAQISAGRVTNYSVDLPTSFSAVSGTQQLSKTTWQLVNGTFTPVTTYTTVNVGGPGAVITNALYNYAVAVNNGNSPNAVSTITGNVVNSGDALIGTTFNAATGQIALANVNATSGGGTLLLDGAIIDTNALGHIHINGGYGNVTVTNETGEGVLVNAINTGNSTATAQSTIKIVDSLKPAAQNTTTYIYSPGTGLAIYQTGFGASPVTTGSNQTTPFFQGSGSSATYQPVIGERYAFDLVANLSRTVPDRSNNFAVSSWSFIPVSGQGNDPWQFVNAGGALQTDPSGSLIRDTGNVNNAFVEQISGTFSGGPTWTIWYHDGHYGFSHNPGDVDGSGNPSDNWYYYFPSSAQLQLSASVKADNSFGLDFSGNAAGSVSITSNAGVAFGGAITNPSGLTAVTASAGNITQSVATAAISTHDLTLSAPSGGIGTTSQPIVASLSTNAAGLGTLNANSNSSGIYLQLGSSATIGSVVAGDAVHGYGDVAIAATGSLLASGSGVNVTANNITLSSSDGSVGSLSQPLVISAQSTTSGNGAVTGGVVNVSAYTDVGITQSGGDLRVGLISSTGGNVLVNVPAGSIYDASAQTSAQTLSAGQVATISQTLHLTESDGATRAAQNSVTTFVNLVDVDLAAYSQLIGNGTVTNGVFTLSSAAIALYKPFAAQALGIAPGAITDAAVSGWANGNYQAYVGVFTQAYGAGWQTAVGAVQGSFASFAQLQNSGSPQQNGSFILTNAGVLGYASAAYSSLQTLAGNGALQGNTFALNSSALPNYAAAALTISNYQTFQTLAGSGSVQGGNLTLNATGVLAFAPTALAAPDYATFKQLVSSINSTVTNGVLTLSPAGITAFTAAAATYYGTGTPTNTQIQAFANSQYQAYVTSIQGYANGQYQSDVQTIQNFANTQYQSFAALPAGGYAAFQALSQSGSVQNGAFTLLNAGIKTYAPQVLSANENTTFQKLITDGSVQNGTFVLSANGLADFRAAAATALGVTNPTDLQVQNLGQQQISDRRQQHPVVRQH